MDIHIETHDIGKLTKEIRNEIIRMIKEKPGNYSTYYLAEKFHLRRAQVKALVDRNDLNSLTRDKRERSGGATRILKRNIDDVLAKIKKKRIAPFKRIRNGYVEYCGPWDEIGIMLDANKPVKFIRKMEPDIFKDDIKSFVPVIAIAEIYNDH